MCAFTQTHNFEYNQKISDDLIPIHRLPVEFMCPRLRTADRKYSFDNCNMEASSTWAGILEVNFWQFLSCKTRVFPPFSSNAASHTVRP